LCRGSITTFYGLTGVVAFMLFLKISEFCMLLQPSLETVTAIPTVLYTEEMQFLYYRTSNKDECFNL